VFLIVPERWSALHKEKSLQRCGLFSSIPESVVVETETFRVGYWA
jgi:hypothetical protein